MLRMFIIFIVISFLSDASLIIDVMIGKGGRQGRRNSRKEAARDSCGAGNNVSDTISSSVHA